MGVFNNWPYTDVHQLNLDFILDTMKDVKGKTDQIDSAVETATTAAENAAESASNAEAAKEAAESAKNNIEDFTTLLTNQVNSNSDNITIQTQRIDEIITGGSVDPDAELLDIRIGGNGITYNTAGNAVRAQYNILKTNCDNITNKMLLKPQLNFWNPSDSVTGYVATNGNISQSTSYVRLQTPISVTPGDIIRCYARGVNFQAYNMRFICAYDIDGNAVSAAGLSASSSTYTVPDGIYSIIPSIPVTQYPIMLTVNYEPAVYTDYDTAYYMATDDFLPESVKNQLRQKVNIYNSDTESEIIGKLVNAYNNGNTDIIFECGVYTFGPALSTVKNDYNLSGNNEIPIGNNNRYYFNGSILNAVVDLATLGTDYYCNLFGTQNEASNFELYDGILNATDTRYIVHDEGGAQAETYKHIYKNMFMTYTTALRTEAIRKCIGGGTGQCGVVIIENCTFKTDGTDSCVSYHGNATDYPNAKFMLTVSNSWLSNSLRAGALSENQTATLLFNNNSSGANIQTYTGWDVISFLNEVR